MKGEEWESGVGGDGLGSDVFVQNERTLLLNSPITEESITEESKEINHKPLSGIYL